MYKIFLKKERNNCSPIIISDNSKQTISDNLCKFSMNMGNSVEDFSDYNVLKQ